MLCFCPVRDRFNNRSINTRLGVNEGRNRKMGRQRLFL